MWRWEKVREQSEKVRRVKGRSKRIKRGLKSRCDVLKVLEGVEGGDIVLAILVEGLIRG